MEVATDELYPKTNEGFEIKLISPLGLLSNH
jgi:hypothetical protein